ncbi:MFS transporter [Embleya scabrispora]|uniref:MFS transporter n=1 Tax=Embleya scabrispora TaxID=159449 RepID=UPI00036290B4|nr:MFS transporter [Embleya scabrispora]MYS84958.1 MFS transporter [Streptomyces sp. SID5474]
MTDVAQGETHAHERAAVVATFRHAPLPAKTLLAGAFVNRLGAFLNIFLVLFLTSQGYSAGQAAFALGVYGGGAIVGVLLGGALSIRLGARNASVLSMVGASVPLAAILYLPSFGPILVAVALVSLAGQLYRPASATLLSDLTPANRQVMIFAMYRFGLNLGTTVAPLFGFALYNLADKSYALVFWVEALISLFYATIAWLTLPARSADGAAKGAEPANADPDEKGADADGKVGAGRGGYRAMLRDRRYTLYLVAIFFFGVVYVQYLSTLPLDVRDSGVAILWYTLAVSLNGFIVISFELLVTKYAQAWSQRLTIAWALVLVGVGVAVYGLPLGPAVILLGTLIWSVGEILGGPATTAYPVVAGPAHLKGHYIGGFHFAWSLGAAVGPVVGGWLFIRLGHQVWPVLTAGSVLSIVLVLLSVRDRPTPEPNR